MNALDNRDISVSVLIPFRNAEETLPECLDSLQQQTLEKFEAVLVNDGSDDRSADIVHDRARSDPRLRLLSPGRVGLVAALNLGLAQVRSELIARMDADDIMHPDRLRRQWEYLHNNAGISLVGCQVELFPDNAVKEGYREYIRWQNSCLEPQDIAANMFIESTFAHPSVMFRRSAVEAAGGYRDGPFPEDYDLWLRLHEHGCSMAKLPQVLLSWRERRDRTSRIDERCTREAFDLIRTHYLARDPRLHSGRDVVVWGGGRSTRLRVKRLLGQGVHIAAWVDVDQRRIGNTIWGLPVHPHTWLCRDPKPFVLVYVNNHGARDEIAAALQQWGYSNGLDYLGVG